MLSSPGRAVDTSIGTIAPFSARFGTLITMASLGTRTSVPNAPFRASAMVFAEKASAAQGAPASREPNSPAAAATELASNAWRRDLRFMTHLRFCMVEQD